MNKEKFYRIILITGKEISFRGSFYGEDQSWCLYKGLNEAIYKFRKEHIIAEIESEP